MSLLTAKFAKKSSFYARIHFIFLRNVPKETLNAFNTKFGPQKKDQKSSYQLRQIFALFCNLIALNLY